MNRHTLPVWATVKVVVKAHFLAGHTKIIIDATGITKASRDSWKSDLWNLRFKVFDVSAEDCIERAKKSNRIDLIPVIERMRLIFEPLEDGEILYYDL